MSDLPQNAVLRFRDEKVEPNVRRAVELAVATLVSRSTTANARRRAAESEHTKLTDAIEAPLTKLIHNDPESVRAIEELRKRPLVEPEHISKLTRNAVRFRRSEPFLVSTRELTRLSGNWEEELAHLGATIISDVLPPFQYTWWWSEGYPPFEGFSHHDGYIGIDARSGLVAGPGGASGFVTYHAGVGRVLQAPSTGMTAYAWAVFEQAHHSYSVGSFGLGSNATAEGSVEISVHDDAGVVVASDSWTLFRKRISGTESASGHGGGVMGIPGDQDEVLSWTMQPGREYYLFVGMGVFTDRSTGIGAAAAQSVIQGKVAHIWSAH